MVSMMVDLPGLFNTDGFKKSSDESMRMKEPIGPAHPRWVGGGHDGKKDLTTAGHGRWCRAVQPPSASDLPPPASCGVCRDGGQIARLGVAAGWSVNRRQLVGSCQASWRRHQSDAGKISLIPPNISGQDRQAADSCVSTDQKIAERIVFQTTTAAVLHKGFSNRRCRARQGLQARNASRDSTRTTVQAHWSLGARRQKK